MEWVRGDPVGHGSFATVNLALPKDGYSQDSPIMVVKSCESFNCSTLENEKQVLDQLAKCPQIIQCLGDNHSFENGTEFYNLLLEYACNGTLSDQLKNRGGPLPEFDVQRYAKSILKGLRDVHAKGFVHCDLKLQNILVFDNGKVKIADFGLSKKAEEKQSDEVKRAELRGTPLYMSPESVNHNEYESPADIWAFGCAVLEMVTAKPAWNCEPNVNIWKLLLRIGEGDEVPQVPKELSDDCQDFLGKCFVKDPRKRWTAEMLLKHSFVADISDDDHDHDTVLLDESPRSPFNFPEWVSLASLDSPELSPDSGNFFEWELNSRLGSSAYSPLCSPADRLRQLVTDEEPDWPFSESWVTVR